MRNKIKTYGQAARDNDGAIVVLGGKIAYDTIQKTWGYIPGSGEEDLERLSDYFSDLAPGEGPVDVVIIIRRK